MEKEEEEKVGKEGGDDGCGRKRFWVKGILAKRWERGEGGTGDLDLDFDRDF